MALGLLQFVCYWTIYLNQAGCWGQSWFPWRWCTVPSTCPECGCLFCWVAEGFAVPNRWLSNRLGWGATNRFKGQAAPSFSVQKGDFMPCPLLPPSLAVLCDVHYEVKGFPSYKPVNHKEPSLRFTGWLWLTCGTCLFTKELQLPMDSRYWKQVVEYLCFRHFQCIGGCRAHRDTESFAQWAGPLDLCGEPDTTANCIILSISVNCWSQSCFSLPPGHFEDDRDSSGPVPTLSLWEILFTVGPKTGNSFEEWCFEARGCVIIHN